MVKTAVLVDSGRLAVRDIAPVPPRGGEVIVAVRACGVCGSDVHAYRTGYLAEVSRPVPDGRVLGHEISGDVIAVGDEVSGFSVGDRVAGVQVGGFAETVPVAVTDRNLHHIPDGLSYTEACTLEPLAVAHRAVRRAELAADATVAVFGAGMISLSCLQVIAARHPAAEIVVVDPVPSRRELARSLARCVAVGPEEVGMRTPEPGFDVAFECAGAPTTPDAAIHAVRRGGRVVVVALYHPSPAVDLGAAVLGGVDLLTSFAGDREDFEAALDLIVSGAAPRRALVTDVVDLDGLAAALDRPDSAAGVKTVVAPYGAQP